MELLIIGGVLAVLLLATLAGYYLLQHRRSGTVKAVIGPRRASARAPGEGDAGSTTGAGES